MRIAFKEWAVVVDALGQGEQILVLRKGGLHEGTGGFQPEHERFWLYPTAYHQQRDSVIPSARSRFDACLQPMIQKDTVPVQFLAQLDSVLELPSLDAALALAGQHIWTEEVVRARFLQGNNRPLLALILHVHALPRPVRLPRVAAYDGCKSWIELEEELDEQGLRPVISRSQLESRRVLVEMSRTPPPLIR